MRKIKSVLLIRLGEDLFADLDVQLGVRSLQLVTRCGINQLHDLVSLHFENYNLDKF